LAGHFPRAPTCRDTFRHSHTFAATLLDLSWSSSIEYVRFRQPLCPTNTSDPRDRAPDDVVDFAVERDGSTAEGRIIVRGAR
jgi:hypothetical protein